MNKNHVGEIIGIYKIIGISDKKYNGKTMYTVQCTECDKVFEKMYNSISGKRTRKICIHNNEKYNERDIYCKNCGEKIDRKNTSLSKYLKRSFCSQSCATSYNNRGVAHNRSNKDTNTECLNCHKAISCKNIFCSAHCQQEYKYKEYIKKWKNGDVNGCIGNSWIDVSGYIRRYLFEKFGHKCSRCGWAEINPYTNKLPLEIEHIDGDATNNKEDNLTILCPNCHSLTKTYRGANKGNGTRDIKWLSRGGTTNAKNVDLNLMDSK